MCKLVCVVEGEAGAGLRVIACAADAGLRVVAGAVGENDASGYRNGIITRTAMKGFPHVWGYLLTPAFGRHRLKFFTIQVFKIFRGFLHR